MSQIKISQLSEFSGSNDNTWVVVNNSGENQTYKAKKEVYFDGFISSSAQVTNLGFALSSDITASFATPNQINVALEGLPTNATISGTLLNYATLSGVSSSFVTNSQLSSSLSSYVSTSSLEPYATLVGVSASFVTPTQITSALSPYALQSSLSNYATLTGVSSSFATPAQITSSISSFPTRAEVTGVLGNYATLTGISGSFAKLTTNTFSGVQTFNAEITGTNAYFNGDVEINGTASIRQLNTISQQSLEVGDKYIIIQSGGVDHTGLDGAGILWGSGSTGPTVDENGANAYIKYVNAYDKLEIFPGLRVSGSITASSSITGSFIGDGSGLVNLPLSSYATSANISSSFATPAQVTASFTTITAKNATTASYIATSSAIATFTNDVRNQLSAGSNLTYASGQFSLNANVNTTSVTASLNGNGSLITNLTASHITNFTSDVRAQFSAGANITITNGVIAANTGSFTIGTGSNQPAGTATLNGNTNVTVTNTLAGVNSIIFLTKQPTVNTPGGNPYVFSKSAGSFVLRSSNNADSDTVAYFIINPA